MILYLEDWDYYPNAIVDLQTKNQSFLKVAQLLKTMGVKNYFFMLTLMDSGLQGVDPHDPNISHEMATRVAVECLLNPWYFFRECLKIPPNAGQAPISLIANRGNMALYWLFFNHITTALIQPRQTGKSVSLDGLWVYILAAGAKNTRINLLTKDDKLRVANVTRLKRMRMYLPAYLAPTLTTDSNNGQEVTVKHHNNILTTAVSQNSEEAALNVGRGLTSAINGVDEAPFISFVDISVPAMLASGGAARDEAEAKGALYGTVFTTTAGKKDSRSGKFMHSIVMGGMPWSEILYDMPNSKAAQEIVTRNCRSHKDNKIDLVNCTFNHRQLGYTDEWLHRKIREAAASGEAADRDYFNRWTSGGVYSPLTAEINEMIRGSQKDCVYTEITKERYAIRWYIPQHEIEAYMAENKVVIGMDTSEAVNRDDITMWGTDVKTLKTVFAFNINETNIITFSIFVANFLVRYENTILIPERRSTGGTIIDMLTLRLTALGIDPFRRIFSTLVEENKHKDESISHLMADMHKRSETFYDKHNRYFGYPTSGSGLYTRDNLYVMTLQRGAVLAGPNVYDKELIDQITGLMVKKGRIDHSSSGNDDLVIAWLLALWFLTSSKALAYYGITNALCDVREWTPNQRAKKAVTETDLYIEEQQKAYRTEMDELLEKLRETNEDYIATKLEMRIKHLDKLLVDEEYELSSLDALLQDAKVLRSKRMRERKNQVINNAYNSPSFNSARFGGLNVGRSYDSGWR